jgi:hypothetical protein
MDEHEPQKKIIRIELNENAMIACCVLAMALIFLAILVF